MPKIFLMVVVLMSYTVLAACGTKGPLYIPEQRYPQQAQKEAPAPVLAAVQQNNTNQIKESL